MAIERGTITTFGDIGTPDGWRGRGRSWRVRFEILVTGAAGSSPSNLIPRLLERGDEVAGVDNFF